jgi:hypothetical protein
MFFCTWGLYIGSKNEFQKALGAYNYPGIGIKYYGRPIIPGINIDRAFWPLNYWFWFMDDIREKA